MKSVDIERQRGRRFLVGAACTSVVIGFIACSGSSEHKSARPGGEAGDGAGGAQAGAPATHQAGSRSAAGESNGGAPNSAGAGGDAGKAGDANAGAGAGGDSGSGGAGQSLAGAAGETFAGGGGAGGAASFVDPVCGVDMVQVGQYSLWCGKVNEHTDPDGLWQPDPDCTSGCNVTGVSYCQKFYPGATEVVTVPQVGTKDWKNAGFEAGQAGPCNDSAPDGPGISGQAACCAPL